MQFSPDQRTAKKFQSNEDEDEDVDVDVISNLPDEILHKILTFLPTKHAVATTALSRRWANLWKTAFLPHLEFNDLTLLHAIRSNPNPTHEQTLFVNFVNNVLRLSNLAKVTTFTLTCLGSYGSSCINSWLRIACTNNITELDIYVNFNNGPIRLPATVYISTSLVVLKLNANVKLDIKSYQVCFPSLKILHIFVYNQKDDDWTGELYRRCPALEDLFLEGQVLHRYGKVQFHVCSSTLKRLKIEFSLLDRFCTFEYSFDYSFLVSAENLENLDVFDNFLAEYNVVNSQVLDRANICIGHPSLPSKAVGFFYANRAFEFLEGISHVKFLSLSGCTIGALSYINEAKLEHPDEFADDSDDDEYGDIDRWQSYGILPTFNSLTNLELGFRDFRSWTILPYILQCSPNLEFLAFKKEIPDKDMCNRWPWKEPEPLPKCMLYCLKEIDIKGFEGRHYELTVVEFLLKNAQVLQRMAIYSPPLPLDEEVMLQKTIYEYPRGSDACQVKFFSNCLFQPYR